MPYPNRHDPELREKMRRLDQQHQLSSDPSSASNANPKSLGERYYENLCMRSVNQSIGRAVRHARDYAAIVLLDSRYSSPAVSALLPGWIARDMVRGAGYGEVHGKLAGFFRRLESETAGKK